MRIKIDIKKTNPTPSDPYEAIDLMVKAQSSLVDALFIMISAIENNTPDFKEINEKRMKDFVKKFES